MPLTPGGQGEQLRRVPLEEAQKPVRHGGKEVAVRFIVLVEEYDSRLATRSEDVVLDVVVLRFTAVGAIRTRNGKDAGIIASADQILRDDQTIAGIDEDARSRASPLTRGPGLSVANIPNDVVVDLVLIQVHFHVHGCGHRKDVGEDVAGDAAVCIAAVEPDGVGVTNMADNVTPEQQVLRVVKLGTENWFPQCTRALQQQMKRLARKVEPSTSAHD